MTRIEQIGDCRLILGDAVELVPALGPIDSIVTDPPYGMLFRSNHRRIRHEAIANDGDAAEKPVSLMERVVRWTDGTVVDPYCGSGSTGVACVRLGRPFIGIEIDEAHFATACRRIEAATKEPRLPLPEPKAKQEALL